jgi:hypothetical protein
MKFNANNQNCWLLDKISGGYLQFWSPSGWETVTLQHEVYMKPWHLICHFAIDIITVLVGSG